MRYDRKFVLHATSVLAFAVFLASVFFILDRMSRQNRILAEQAGISLWHISQLDIEYLRLVDYLNRFGLGAADADHEGLLERYDILWSRLPHLLEGRHARYYRSIEGFRERLGGAFEEIKAMEQAFQDLAPADRPASQRLVARLAKLGPVLHQLLIDATHGTERRSSAVEELRQFLYLGLLGVVVGGGVLILLLIREVGETSALLRDATATGAELRRAKERAEADTSAKSAFLANMSHELRTPLNAIMGFSGIMREQTFGPLGDPKYEYYADGIHASGEHLLGLINDVLDLSKVEAGRLEVEVSALDVADTVGQALAMVGSQAEAAECRLEADIDDNIPTLYADRRMVTQVLLNLLSNAIKFTPVGGHIRMHAAAESGGDIVFSVSDTGIGMDAEMRVKATDPFSQADTRWSRDHPGTGLGLPLTKGLVELHGGCLDIESEPGSAPR